MTIQRLVDLLYLMLPVYVANMAPPFVKFWHGWNPPISLHRLGSHKTVVGFGLGIAAAMIVTALQYFLAWERSLVDYSQWLPLGLSCGFGAMAGDSIKSFFKRRRRIAPGTRWVPVDQLDFVIGGLMALSIWYPFTWPDLVVIASVSFVGDIIVNQLAYRLGIRDTAW